MWPSGEGPSVGGARASTGSEVVIVDDCTAGLTTPPVCDAPVISNLNVTKSEKFHIGHKFVTVTNNVHSNEVVKGPFLCFELVSPAHAKRLRCSVAVFVCWAIIVASGLAVYLCYFILTKQPAVIDLDVSCPRYMWHLVKNSTRAERISCSVAMLLIIVCIILIVYFTVIVPKSSDEDKGPAEWKISRETWLARKHNNSELPPSRIPLRLVIIHHTAGSTCSSYIYCCAEMRNLQSYYLDKYKYDIPYNFLIGNDGRVYEGRGWGIEGAHTFTYNNCSLGIGFFGDYREELPKHTLVTELQLNRTLMLLEEGVRDKHLHPRYRVVGAKDVQPFESPGSSLYNAIQKWEHYDHDHLYSNKSCNKIYALPIDDN